MRHVKWIALAVLLVAAGALWWLRPRGAEAELLAEAPYRILKEHEPLAWARVLAAYERMKIEPAARADFVNLANAEFGAAATRRLGRASASATLALMHDMVATLERLQARPGDACFRYLYPEIGGGADVARQLDPQAQARTLTLAAEVIRSAAEDPAPRVSREAAAQALGPVVDAVYAEFGTDTQMMSHPAEPGVDRSRICAIALSLYRRILALPPAQAAQLFAAVTDPS